MKILSNTTGTNIHWTQRTLEGTLITCSQAIRRIRKNFKNLWTKVQIKQMQSVLHALSDEQLKKMGIKRDGIRAHAKHLITYEYDGL